MKKSKTMCTLTCIFGCLVWFFLTSVDLAEARLGRGRSMGFRGSRTYSAPRRTVSPPATSKTQPNTLPRTNRPGTPSRLEPTTTTPSPASGGLWRGVTGGLAGGLLGGMIGSLLFGGLGHAGGALGGGGSSFGLLDLALLGGLLYLGYRLFFRRRQDHPSYSFQAGSDSIPGSTPWMGTSCPAGKAVSDPGPDLAPIKAYDPQFDKAAFTEWAQDVFFKLQSAWMRQDLALMKDLATPEMLQALSRDLDDMRARGQINRLENIAVRQVGISEAWQEAGQEYITVGFRANLLDYVVDSRTSEVVAGSTTEPVKFEEYWTFVRPMGQGPWKLTAIQQP